METRPKVLLVDDEPLIVRAVAGMLESGGFDVVTCEQWTQVANTVRQEEPDIVLLDYNMPTLKGDSICSILKRNVHGWAMRILLFSSEPETELARISSECGADGYVCKNTPAPELLGRLRLLSGEASPTCA